MTRTQKTSPWYRAIAPAAIALLFLALAGVTAGCSTQPDAHGPEPGHEAALPDGFPEAPDWYRAAPEPIQQTYVAAAHHPEALQYIPCYCGCGEIHGSNFDCYFQRDESGAVVAFDPHARG